MVAGPGIRVRSTAYVSADICRRMDKDTITTLLAQAGACASGAVVYRKVDSSARTMFRNWLACGCNGSMDWMKRNEALYDDPEALLAGTRTIVCAAFSYGGGERHSLFADYARGADYHKALVRRLRPVARELQRLAPGSRTRICVDSAPLRERYWAALAGVGHIGVNGLLIVPGIGSKVFLAEILWTEAIDGLLSGQQALLPQCSLCGACVRACPGGALDGKGGMDARRCLSYLTIEHRGELPPGITLPGRIYGCDICQDVCPENNAAATSLPEFAMRRQLAAVDADAIAHMDETGYAEAFAGSAIRRAPLPQLQRNLSSISIKCWDSSAAYSKGLCP